MAKFVRLDVMSGNKDNAQVKSAKYYNADAVAEVENGTIANIYTQNGLIVVEGECQIFTITGQNVTQMNGNLIRGVYIVRTANATSKVIIK